MKIQLINTVNFGSTGNIMLKLSSTAEQHGITFGVAVASSRSNRNKFVKNQIEIGTRASHFIHSIFARVTGFQGCGSLISTWNFLHKLQHSPPDLIHLHNLHNNYINLPMLFHYIKKHRIPVVWTLHDCWALTGQCPHFTVAKCNKWKTGCHTCQQYRDYPSAYVDRTSQMWKLKKKWFTGVENLTIVTPSQWLADLVKESYLKEYPVRVIHNGVDLNVFKPTKSRFREQYHLEDKYIILGVAMPWSYKKGMDVFAELDQRLERDKYQIVLVGTTEDDDQNLPDHIISIHRTSNQRELSEIYSSADVFVNPTREEVLGLVNVEALACGTPVVTFDTGGSPECIDDSCGLVVPCDDIDAMEGAIRDVCVHKIFTREACIKRAQYFDANTRFNEYIELYCHVMGESEDTHNEQ